MNFYGEFEWRGLVYDATEGLQALPDTESLAAYAGFDATARSLHVGHLLPALALRRLQLRGHRPIAVVGGGTGLIGDPSGKSTERALLSREHVDDNARGIQRQLERLLDFDAGPFAAALVNNAEWLSTMSAMTFLRDVGKYFSVNAMLAKESVKRRLASEDGISYTEFSYSLLQAFDFLTLFDRFQCRLQVGGSDQWGNIVAGCDLIRRLRGAKAHGLVMPLLMTAAGTKFGKTETGSVWLDPGLTKPYEFYQFWLNVDDRDAVRYLRFFTLLDAPRIGDIEQLVALEPERREAQKVLAREVTQLVHGAQAVVQAEVASEKLFGGRLASMSMAELLEVFPNVPSTTIERTANGWSVVELLALTGVAASRGEATRLIRGGGVYVNDRRVVDDKERLSVQHAIDGQIFLIRKGKKDNFLLRIAAH